MGDWVQENDPSYCNWVRQQSDPSADLLEFQEWLQERMAFGMHYGQFKSWVLEHEPDYCDWAIRQLAQGPLLDFQNWLETERHTRKEEEDEENKQKQKKKESKEKEDHKDKRG